MTPAARHLDSIGSAMELVVTATFGLVVWIVIWSLGTVSGFDAAIIGIVLVLVVTALRNVVPYLSRKDK